MFLGGFRRFLYFLGGVLLRVTVGWVIGLFGRLDIRLRILG